VVAGEIPREPLGFQPRADLLAALDAPGPGPRVVHALTGMRGVARRIWRRLMPRHRELPPCLASVYRNAGRTDEAITLHEQTLTAMEHILGPDHPDTLLSRNDLTILLPGRGPHILMHHLLGRDPSTEDARARRVARSRADGMRINSLTCILNGTNLTTRMSPDEAG
jgi:Tetratricopeptide repeat